MQAAGVDFQICPSSVDESVLKQRYKTEALAPDLLAQELALAKAKDVASRSPDHFVIGSDQVLVCEGRTFDKSSTQEEARQLLRTLRGKEHQLICGTALVKDEAVLWRHTEVARLWMRDFSDDFLEDYLKKELPAILGSVGVYHIEERGAQLFERIEGDLTCVRGLPLLPLLKTLRFYGHLAS